MFNAKYKTTLFSIKISQKMFSFPTFHKHISPYKENLFKHKIYGQVNDITKTKLFMESHVFGLWDYLTMLKSLQRDLAARKINFLDKDMPNLPYLINQIVLNECVDEEGSREYLSALGIYQLYIKAMEEIGADIMPISYFVDCLKSNWYWKEALEDTKKKYRNIPNTTYSYLEHNLEVIENSQCHEVAGVFFFSREDIHSKFANFIKVLQEKDMNITNLRNYLQKHIEDDGETKNPILGEYILNLLCNDDAMKWKETELAVIKAIKERQVFWDGILEMFERERILLF